MENIKKRPFVGISIIILLVSLPTFTSSGAATHQSTATFPESRSSVVNAGLPGALPDSINKSGSSLVQGSMVKAAPLGTSKPRLGLSASSGTVINPSGGFLGNPLCPSISFGACYQPTSVEWTAGYMDQVVSPNVADAVSALVSLPSTSGIPSDFIRTGNYLAVGIMGQGQSNATSGCPQTCGSEDYAFFAMLYTAPNLDQTYIVGEVWTSPNPLKGESALLLFSKGWTDPSLGYYKTIQITMKWNHTSGNLDWIARLYGVEQTLFSYTPNHTQFRNFHVGTTVDNGFKVKWFQFGIMSHTSPSYPVSAWHAYVASPEYLAGGTWHSVDTSSLTWGGGGGSWVDGGGFEVGTDQTFANMDTCKTGGKFPVFNDLLRSGQIVFHWDSGPTTLGAQTVWDSSCPKDTVSPTSTFSSPSDGTWENSGFSISYSDSDPGTVATGVEQCYWAISSSNGVSWIQTQGTTVRQCTFISGVTVGPSSNCPFEGSRSCRVDLWAEDRAGNIATAVSRYFSIDTGKPSAPLLLLPANGAVSSNTPTYTWSASTDATRGVTGYLLGVSTDPTFPICHIGQPCARRVVIYT